MPLHKLPKNKCDLLLFPSTSSFHSNYGIFGLVKRKTPFMLSGLPPSSIEAAIKIQFV